MAVRKLGRSVSKIVARAEWKTAQALRFPQSSLFEMETPFEVEAKVEELMFEMVAKVETSVGVMVA
ncbi:MAG: hypothetical protein ABSA11_12665 [Candidatus Bathyarchaeia archaeon]